ncbi:MAG: Rv3235 family protein [Mycetocola sp.]
MSNAVAHNQTGTTRPRGERRGVFDAEQFFGHQPTSSCDLPDPHALIENLASSVVEVLAGARDLEQLSRWITHDVYAHLLRRSLLAARSRRSRGVPARRPRMGLGPVHTCAPADGVVEAVTIVSTPGRARAVAIRLEGVDGRWKASSIAVL